MSYDLQCLISLVILACDIYQSWLEAQHSRYLCACCQFQYAVFIKQYWSGKSILEQLNSSFHRTV